METASADPSLQQRYRYSLNAVNPCAALTAAAIDETAAKALAAQAEADVKAAQAAGLQQQADVHRNEASTSRDHLNEQWDRADTLDPATRTGDASPSGGCTENPAAHTVSP